LRATDLKGRIAEALAAQGGARRLGELAASFLQVPDSPLARRTLRALLQGDARFVIAGDEVELAVEVCPLAGIPLDALTFAVLDFETNGCPPRDRAIELGISVWRCGEEVGTYERLIDPGTPVAPFVTRLTGIRRSDLEGCPPFEEVLPEVAPLLEGAVLVAHNLPFDRRILLDELDRAGGDPALASPAVCTLRLARRLLPKEERKNLDALAERFGLEFTARHRALGDAKVTGRLLHILLQLARERTELHTLEDLQLFLADARPVGAEVLPPTDEVADHA
jgi:DNA polymerase III epsilon subunit-like protein